MGKATEILGNENRIIQKMEAEVMFVQYAERFHKDAPCLSGHHAEENEPAHKCPFHHE